MATLSRAHPSGGSVESELRCHTLAALMPVLSQQWPSVTPIRRRPVGQTDDFSNSPPNPQPDAPPPPDRVPNSAPENVPPDRPPNASPPEPPSHDLRQPPTPPHDQQTRAASSKLPPLAIIYSSCRSDILMRGHDQIPSFRCKCDDAEGINYCYEGDCFLKFLIDVYDRPIASRYVFAQDHVYSWHYQSGFWHALGRVMSTPYWREQKYGGIFKGYWKIGQTGPWGGPDEKPWVDPIYKVFFAGTSMPVEPVWNNSFPCCSTFFFDEDLIRNRRKEEYIRIWQQMRVWVKENLHMPHPGHAYKCGRVFEFTWHMLLTRCGFVPYCHDCAL